MARVSIITRTVDRPQLLGRMLDSLLDQHYTDWECLIVNGGPAPLVQQLIAARPALANRVRLLPFENPQPGMRGIPLNHGIAHSTGELITILDDDDTWDPAFLQRMVTTLDSLPQAGGVVCQTKVIEETSVAEGLQPQRDYVLNPDLLNATLPRLAVVNAWCIHAFIYRRSAFDALGTGYAENLAVLEDWDFNLRFLAHCDVVVLPQVLTNYHQRPQIKTGHEANSLHGELDLHKFHESQIINSALRRDWQSGRAGLGQLLASAAQARYLERRIHQVESKIKPMAEKIGKIDARTKELKDRR
jgi:glycosyltransferase involved in cell wall biosynthesis